MKKILIVNDCKFESFIMKDCLNDIGYSVQITNEYDVFVQIRKFQPDVIIANLIMKDTTGDKLIEYIKSTDPKIMCLLSSCDLIRLENYIEQKIDEVIHTPIDKLGLLEILNRVSSKGDKVNAHVNRKSIDEIFKRLDNKSSGDSTMISLSKTSMDEKVNGFSFCPYCGQKLAATDRNFLFCPYCGEKMKN